MRCIDFIGNIEGMDIPKGTADVVVTAGFTGNIVLKMLEGVSETGPTVNDPPMHNTRHFPAAAGIRPDVFELVRAGGYDRDATEIWEGSAELRLFDDTLEDLQAIAPREVLRGYRFSFGYTVDGVEVVARHAREGAA